LSAHDGSRVWFKHLLRQLLEQRKVIVRRIEPIVVTVGQSLAELFGIVRVTPGRPKATFRVERLNRRTQCDARTLNARYIRMHELVELGLNRERSGIAIVRCRLRHRIARTQFDDDGANPDQREAEGDRHLR
jgi:hypothetical protein